MNYIKREKNKKKMSESIQKNNNTNPGIDVANIISQTIENIKPVDKTDIYSSLQQWEHLQDPVTAFFMLCIGLFMVCLVYLYSTKTTNIAWIIAFFLNIIFIIIWVPEALKYSQTGYSIYTLACLIITAIFNFVTILLIFITNSIVTQRTEDYHKNDLENGIPIDQIKYEPSPTIKNNLKNNRILFTTIVVTSIALLINYFYDAEERSKRLQETKQSSIFGQNIHWLIGFFPEKLRQFDQFWHSIFKELPLDPVLKMFLLFCFGFFMFFLVPFTRIFQRDLTPEEIKTPTYPPRYRPYLIEPVNDFPAFFDFSEVEKSKVFDLTEHPKMNYHAFSSFISGIMWAIIVFIIACLACSIFYWLEKLKWIAEYKWTAGIGGAVITFILVFILNLIDKKNFTKDNNFFAKQQIYLALTFIFGLFGFPVVMMILELFLRFVLNKSFIDKRHIIQNGNIWMIGLSAVIFLILWLTLYGVGNNSRNEWFTLPNNKDVKLLIIACIGLFVGWFFAFSPYFYMFYGIVVFLFMIIRYILYIFGPIGILGLSITDVIMASDSSNSRDKVTKPT